MTGLGDYHVVVPETYQETFEQLLHEHVGNACSVSCFVCDDEEIDGPCVGADLPYEDAEIILHCLENDDIVVVIHSLYYLRERY